MRSVRIGHSSRNNTWKGNQTVWRSDVALKFDWLSFKHLIMSFKAIRNRAKPWINDVELSGTQLKPWINEEELSGTQLKPRPMKKSYQTLN